VGVAEVVSLAIAGEPQVISREDTTDLNLTFSLCVPAGQHIFTESFQIIVNRITLRISDKLTRGSYNYRYISVALIDTVESAPHTSGFLGIGADPSGFSP